MDPYRQYVRTLESTLAAYQAREKDLKAREDAVKVAEKQIEEHKAREGAAEHSKRKRRPRRPRPVFADTPLGRAQLQAWRRKIDWAISADDYYRLTSQPCSYCGKDIGERGVRLDRLDSSGAYRLDNVAPCCYRCNMIKGRFLSPEQMRKVGSLL